MSKKVNLRLLGSTKMSDKNEDSYIRFPRKTREFFSFKGPTVSVGRGEYELDLKIKSAYKEDLIRLKGLIKSGKISKEDAYSAGFVTKSVQQKIIQRNKKEDIWISNKRARITIGADPEFGLINNLGLLVRGQHILPHAGKFGSDGPSVEVRPDPSTDHLKVVENMRQILLNPPAPVDSYNWKGGATFTDPKRTYWFGGHIHLGRPNFINRHDSELVYDKIATILDGLLALPLVRFDSPEPWKRRSGCKYKYGVAGDIRSDYPEGNRFEYRVLSGLWMSHPTLSKVVLGTAKCIAETAYQRIFDKGTDLDWALENSSRDSLLKTFSLNNMKEIKAVINRARPEQVNEEQLKDWEKNIRSLDKFEDYAVEVEALIALTKEDIENTLNKVNLDIKSNWQEEKPLLDKMSKKLKSALEKVEEK